LGSYPFVAYPSCGGEWLLTTELFLGVLLLWCCVSPIGVLLYYGNAPGYKLAQALVRKLTSYIPLPFTYNIKNSPADG